MRDTRPLGPPPMPDQLTRAAQRVLDALADGKWHPEPELRSSFAFLQRLCFRGLLDGAMVTGGGTPEDRIWRIPPDA